MKGKIIKINHDVFKTGYRIYYFHDDICKICGSRITEKPIFIWKNDMAEFMDDISKDWDKIIKEN